MLKTFFIIQSLYRAMLDILIYRIIEIVEIYPNIFSIYNSISKSQRHETYNFVVETHDS